MINSIPIQVKRTCCEMREQGVAYHRIYDEYFKLNVQNPMSFRSFETSLGRWSKKTFPDDLTLRSGTYEGFTAHGATVQVSANGEIERAWIKETANAVDPEEFIQAIREVVEPYKYEPPMFHDASGMLEIPLFDMHWGINFLDYYKPVLNEILQVIRSKRWERIVIPFGQDFFHNDSLVNGQTTKGTVIQKVDMVRAVKDGKIFIYAIVDEALANSSDVKLFYTPGNHDKSISWMFMQTLLERYGPGIVDDSWVLRKVVTYGKNSVMFTHGDAKRATAKNLAHEFPTMFPTEFAETKVREVHAGHLHHEEEGDIFGIMVRRLSSGTDTDDWSDSEDFVGSMKRFMLFVWSHEALTDIHYVYT